MLPLLLPSEVLRLDALCASDLGISSLQLMEMASQATSDAIENIIQNHGLGQAEILIAYGNGNNGGDGLCIARMLSVHHTVTVVGDNDAEIMTPSTRTNLLQLPETVCRTSWDNAAKLRPHVVIDALIGIGCNVDLRVPLPQYLQELNGLPGIKIAVDVPTGLNATNGRSHRDVFRADVTITIEAAKPGFYRNDGPLCVGEIVVVRLGLPNRYAEQFASTFRLESEDIRRILPQRARNVSKFSFGRVLVIGGTAGMPGAPSLTSHAALAAGAGLVELAVPLVHPLTPREVMASVMPMHSDGTIHIDARDQLLVMAERATVIAIGPGLGTNNETLRMLASIVDAFPQTPCVIDADGLRLLRLLSRALTNVIITPHLGELARLLEVDRKTIEDPVQAAQEYSRTTGTVVHVKDVPSVTTDGLRTFLTVAGNPGMATAGCGDVLTGIVAGLVAQGLSMIDAGALGAFLHARAGDITASEKSHESMLASDIIAALDHLLK